MRLGNISISAFRIDVEEMVTISSRIANGLSNEARTLRTKQHDSFDPRVAKPWLQVHRTRNNEGEASEKLLEGVMHRC